MTRKDIDFPAGIKDWKKIEQNNKEIALNISYVPPNTKTINLAYKSKYNRKCKNQVVLLMITNDNQSDEIDKWRYIALKSVPAGNGFICPIRSLSILFRGIASNDNRDFYCLSCLLSFRTDNALKNMKDYVITTIIAIYQLPHNDNTALKYNHGEKSLKASWVIYADFECLP